MSRTCDWQMLAAWTRAEWNATDAHAHPYHKGLREAYQMIAREMSKAAPEDREAVLYDFIAETLSGGNERAE